MKLKTLCNPDLMDIFKETEGEEDVYCISKIGSFKKKDLLLAILECFWESEYMQQVLKVREYQKQYFKSRTNDLLKLCQMEERKLDDMLMKVHRHIEKGRTTTIDQSPQYTQKTIGE